MHAGASIFLIRASAGRDYGTGFSQRYREMAVAARSRSDRRVTMICCKARTYPHAHSLIPFAT
ncbi:hypothetical protein L288_01115 [Sphingobium quisquiliarum P25]|uniref:Uncharacterized protein n=1 Tax=Sphingobium quisquiliarum P25 TaxID=1329909 RepID=T0IYP6_9SPHN|nr:hypothetical protein L288_01115 [Sphingobium quisquiliarum P25]